MSWERLPAYAALKPRDRLMVARHVRRGECPNDPAVAAATVEFGEDVLSGRSRIWYWIGFLFFVAWAVVWLVVDIAEGRPLRGVTLAAVFLVAAAVSSQFNPIFWRRQRVVASIEAARVASPER